MTKKKLAIFAASFVGTFMVVALTVGVVYKINKAAEYERYLSGQEQSQQLERDRLAAEKAAAEKAAQKPIPPIVCEPATENTNPPPAGLSKAIAPEKPTSSVPEVVVSTDEKGNQTITPEWEKPAEPPHKDIHDPESKPETPKKPDKNTDPDVEFDGNGNQVPNADGEVFVPGFGWIKSSPGGKSEQVHNAGTGDVVGY